jgi:hypothetical protein
VPVTGAANAERMRQRRAASRAAREAFERAHPGQCYVAPDAYVHGLRSTYENFGCRCEPCTGAEAAHHRRHPSAHRYRPHHSLPAERVLWLMIRQVNREYPWGWSTAELADALGGEVSVVALGTWLSYLARAGRLEKVADRPERRLMWWRLPLARAAGTGR